MDRRSKKIDKIKTLVEAEEQRCGQLAGKSQAELQRQRARLDELNLHRRSYASEATKVGRIDSARWQDFQNFLRRLDQAVLSQQQIVEECEKNVELHRKQWLETRQRRESLENVVERHRRDERVHDERLEQRKLDDLQTSPPGFDDE